MKRALVAMLVCFTAGAALGAEARDEARTRDLQRLQDDAANLDAALEALEPGDKRTEEFRTRGEEIREEVIYLKVKMRKHERSMGESVAWTEVQDLQRTIRDLREDIEASFGQSERTLRLAEGTEIHVRLETALSSKTSRLEDRFEASVIDPVRHGGDVAIPAGARVRGVVRSVEPAHRPSREGRIELQFDALYLDRTRFDIRGTVTSLGEKQSSAETAKKAGIGAVLGGVLGSLFGGKDAAIVGVVLGGGGAVAGTKGDDVELPVGAALSLRLDKPLDIPRD
jgi:HAMP domain-containing protein